MEKLTRYEKARIISARAFQISMGAPVLLKSREIDPINLAKAEFAKEVIPIVVKR